MIVHSQSRLRGLIKLTTLVCSIAGCGIRATTPAAEITVVPDTVALNSDSDATWFAAQARILNRGATPIYVNACGADAQRKIDDEWQTVWSPICGSTILSRVEPGAFLTVPITALGYRRNNSEPRLDPRMRGGVYRFRFGIGSEAPVTINAPSDLPVLASRVFFVKDTAPTP